MSGPVGMKTRLLVIDDDLELCLMLHDLFLQAGLSVVSESGGVAILSGDFGRHVARGRRVRDSAPNQATVPASGYHADCPKWTARPDAGL